MISGFGLLVFINRNKDRLWCLFPQLLATGLVCGLRFRLFELERTYSMNGSSEYYATEARMEVLLMLLLFWSAFGAQFLGLG